ncbi:MAG: hypothetical protein HXX13_07420 [Bacteroidetes bacterium]|nr:hypothetical protein [Bacteroidota bacterium]
MKKKYISRISFLALISVVLLLSCYSCKKDDSPAGTGKTLEFVGLKAEKDTIVVQEVTKITATVTGEGLSYAWKCDNELGVIDGSGAEVMFTICHAGKFKITCDVTDSNNNKATKDVYVTTVE